MKIVFASDHAGLPLKLELKNHLIAKGYEAIDLGTDTPSSTDYPLWGKAAAEVLLRGEADKAVLVCGTGFGISLAANKHKGVRCVNCSEPYTAAMARRHNNANAIALGARVVGVDLAKLIVDTFLDAEFEGERHSRRVGQLVEIEESNFC
ncbi:MAG: ribose 5-phosphate isomerase B [Oscillospiraceae bacterium]|jgi:ribose 5-phosphate isomerase B|nr:ribose 5-phosphate isomerase B [Oscillospiraceae bacterium]